MNYSEYEQYASEANIEAGQNFSLYKFKVAAFAILGYLVIFAILFTLIGMTGGLIAAAFVSSTFLIFLIKKKLIFVIIPFIWILLRSLWVKFEQPKGYLLTRQRFPVLYKELDELSTKLDSLKVHQVILTPELNASVLQTPRLGIFGWQKNTLFLGLELLLTLSPVQARAVVAHEFGHLSGNHSRFNGWIYRVRESWYRLTAELSDESGFGSRLLNKFFDWYAPRFSAYSFPLARFNEYEADSISASLTSAGDAGEALVNVHVTAPYIDQNYWNNYFKKADELAEPDHLPWEGLNDFLKTNEIPELKDNLNTALEQTTGFSDTHPCLTDRLAALKVEGHLPKHYGDSAAKAWFADEYENVIRDFDNNWQQANHEKWKQRYEYVTQSRQTLEELEASDVNELTDEQLWKLAMLNEEFGSRESTLEALYHYRKRQPDDPDCAYVLGRNLYAMSDRACLDEFEKSSQSLNLASDSCWYAWRFLTDLGEDEAANSWQQRAELAEQQQNEAEQERHYIDAKDELVKPNQATERYDTILQMLKDNKKIKKAWIAQKVTKYYQDYPAYAVAVIAGGFSLMETSLQKQLSEDFADQDVWIIPKTGDFKPLAKHIIKHGIRVL